MRKWQGLGTLVILGSFVACATATNGGTPAGESGGTDAMGGDTTTNPAGGDGSVTAGTSSSASGSTSSFGGTGTAFGGSAGVAGGTAGSGTAGSSSAGGASGGAGSSFGGSSGTSSGAGGVSSAGSGTAGSGTAGAGTAGSAGSGSTGPCMNPVDKSGGNSGDLGAGPDVCIRTMDKFNTVGCSNFDGRMLIVNGMPATCGVAATYTQIGGYNYIEVTGTGETFASLSWFCSAASC
ncbi:MAG TPA: hypothetical protein VHV51_21175 [Polyangiaceae bacterium]|jgi:hypothetical protein|nr:hypothetical protein [Polyangiaceae bacterium]